MNSEFTKYICWDQQQVSNVINTEAVSMPKNYFLATHTPFPKFIINKAPKQIKDFSEETFLQDLLKNTSEQQHVFSVIRGIPGSGKSHLIRWLKERYENKVQSQEISNHVLLIERMNNSLKSTLLQIIKEGVFHDEIFREYKRKLDRATTTLSKEGLEKSLIDSLAIAHGEGKSNRNIPRNVSERLEALLHDPNIRSELRREGGGIQRIISFLAGGIDLEVENQSPHFTAEDFLFSVEVMNRIRREGANVNAKNLAQKLHAMPELREDLADYLNGLLEFAIGRVTSLTSEDLKKMFIDLRRELKKQGSILTLFIEDITSFTGLDKGIVDVLVTQHTGEQNKELCQIISVVGVTDSYYHDNFPDNIKDRITHLPAINTLQKFLSYVTSSIFMCISFN